MESTREIFDQWGKPRESFIRRRKRIKLIKIALICVAVILLSFWGVYSFTDLIYKPDTDINSSPVAAGDWSMYGRDPLHTGGQNMGDSILQGNVKTLLNVGDIIRSSPAVSNGIIYFGSRNSYFYAVDAATGAKLWEFKTISWVESSPAIVNNVVYFGSNDGNLYALNALTGEKLWSFHVPFPIKSSPAVADGIVYFGCDDYAVYALDARTGKKRWSIGTGDVVSASPVVSGGLVFFGSWDSYFYTVDAKKGRLHLKMPATKSVISSPAVKDDIAYFINSEGTLIAVDIKARNWPGENRIRPNWQILYIYGALPQPPAASGYLWSVRLNKVANESPSSPALANGRIYAGAGKKVVAVDLQSHEIIWSTDTSSEVSSTPIVSGSLVYAAGKDGVLNVLDAATGEKLKEIPVGGEIYSAPAMVDGVMYITSADGSLYAID